MEPIPALALDMLLLIIRAQKSSQSKARIVIQFLKVGALSHMAGVRAAKATQHTCGRATRKTHCCRVPSPGVAMRPLEIKRRVSFTLL